MKRLCAALVLVCLIVIPLLAAPRTGWEIVRADYGWGNNLMDVTDRVRSLVQGDQLKFMVDGNALGADRPRGRDRVLRLWLKDGQGRDRRIAYHDGQLVHLPIYIAYQGNLHINRAVYGIGNRSFDVTSRLNSRIEGEQLNVQVNNQNMGGDPAPYQTKTLTVEYTLNGETGNATIREGEVLLLPYSNNSDVTPNKNTSDVTPSDNNRDGTLQVTVAFYGSGYLTADVTSRVNSQVHGGQINLLVNDDSMGGDPAPGQAKALTVQYAINGETNQIVVNEGDTLRLPLTNTSQNNGDGNGEQLSQRVRCEAPQAEGNGRHYCAANTRGGIRLIRTIDNSECTEGSTWGYDNGGIWVDKGCRAEFELGNVQHQGMSTSATIPNGTEISVRTNETIDSRTATVGQTFSAVLATDVLDSVGAVRIPKGSEAQLVIRSASGDSTSSASDLVLDVNSLTVSGTKYVVSTGDLGQQGVGKNRHTAVMVGGGAVLGSLIGAIAGGGKGAAIGAAVGAGAGLGAEVLTKGKQVRVPAETLLRFKLDQDLRLRLER